MNVLNDCCCSCGFHNRTNDAVYKAALGLQDAAFVEAEVRDECE